VIADPRIVTKAYGRGLLDGLPGARRKIGPWSDVVNDVRAFFKPACHPERSEGSAVSR
jgi:ATP-dependent DNA helicase DinG